MTIYFALGVWVGLVLAYVLYNILWYLDLL